MFERLGLRPLQISGYELDCTRAANNNHIKKILSHDDENMKRMDYVPDPSWLHSPLGYTPSPQQGRRQKIFRGGGGNEDRASINN